MHRVSFTILWTDIALVQMILTLPSQKYASDVIALSLLQDTLGDEHYVLSIINIQTGESIIQIDNCSGYFEWSGYVHIVCYYPHVCRNGYFLYYVVKDETSQPHQVSPS